MSTRKAQRLKERAAPYATRTASHTRQPRLYPQARHLTRPERLALKAYQDYLLEKFPDTIERIVLFGSKARGDSTSPSDLDMLVVVRSDDTDFSTVEDRWRDVTRGAHEIGFQYGLDISVIVRSHRQMQEWTPLLAHIHQDGIELWRRPGTRWENWPLGGEAAVALGKQEHIKARMRIARDKLQVARDLLEKGHYNDVISRAYYAMFYASKALLLALGEDPHKHTGVVSLYGQRIVKIGLTDPKYGVLLSDAKKLREDADYGVFFHATREQAESAIKNAEDFVREAEETLKKIQNRGESNVH